LRPLDRIAGTQPWLAFRRAWPFLLREPGLVPLLLLMVPVALIIRLLRPLVLIRTSPLPCNRIGHFAANTEIYLCERDAGMHGKRTLDIFFYPHQVCSQQLRKMWDRILTVSFLARPLDMVSRRLPGAHRHTLSLPGDFDAEGLLPHGRIHLRFTADEERWGQASLERLGIPERTPFVCFYARDSAYLDVTQSYRTWDYHDYRDSCIDNYLLAVEEMTRRGYPAVRMGAVVKEALDTDNPMIIDYASTARTDFLDIYLSAKCRFFISSTGGINAVPRIFRKPVVYVNFVPLGEWHLLVCSPDSVFIPKKHWHREEERYLTFGEIVRSGKGVYPLNKRSGLNRFLETEMFDKSGVDLQENSPEEIAAAAIEMDDRLNGSWVATQEDEELQRRFHSLFDPREYKNGLLPRIGAEFLRQNRDLLD